MFMLERKRIIYDGLNDYIYKKRFKDDNSLYCSLKYYYLTK